MVFNVLRQLRTDAGVTQAGLADAVSVTRQTIISIEQGRHSPSVELAIRIARHLGVTVEEVFSLEQS